MTETVNIGSFPLGINNVADENNLPEGSLREAIDVDLSDGGFPQRRKGQKLLYSGKDIHSLYKRYFIEDRDLKYLNSDNTASVIRSGLTTNRKLTYTEVNGEIYISNGKENFKVNGEWGIPSPAGKPALSQSTGNFPKGTYQVAVCWMSDDKELSGTGTSQQITIEANRGIALSNLPQSSDGYHCVVFVSNTNGDVLYYHSVVQNGISDVNLYNEFRGGKVLNTQFLERAPAGQIIRYFQGRIFIADGNTVWYTEPLNYGLYKPSENFIQFSERVTILEPTDSGIFICSDRTYFLGGKNPKQFSQRVVSEDTGIEGTGLQVESKHFGAELSSMLPFWWTNKGAVLGFPDGKVKNITEDRLAIDGPVIGSSMYREIDGIRQVITNLKKNGEENGFGATDYATATVIRNGVII